MSSTAANNNEFDAVSDSVRVGYDGTTLSPSLAIVEAIADLADVKPADLAVERGFVLYDHVDPDAIDALVTGSPGSEVDIFLTVADYDVRIDGAEVTVRRSGE